MEILSFEEEREEDRKAETERETGRKWGELWLGDMALSRFLLSL